MILITGASGLIGGRLIEHLRRQAGGIRVRAASRVARAWPAGVESCTVDLARPETHLTACAGVDAVINLVGMEEREASGDALGALHATAGAALSFVSAAAATGVRRFVQVSTSKVYGNNPTGRITEATLPRPQSNYAIAHRTAEDFVRSRHRNAVIFRLANGFGAPVDLRLGWQIIVNEFCRQAVEHGRITIRSSGLAWRNFVPIADVIRALAAGADDLAADIYNLGSCDSMPLRVMAERVARVCRETLEFEPHVSVGPVEPGEHHEPLDLSIDALTRAGVAPGASIDREIAATLMCARQRFVA